MFRSSTNHIRVGRWKTQAFIEVVNFEEDERKTLVEDMSWLRRILGILQHIQEMRKNWSAM